MILTDVLDRPVHDARGQGIGYVIDVRFVLDGPPGPVLAAARLHGLLVSPRARTPFLGYERSEVRSPWPVPQLLRWWHRGTFLVRWEDVSAVEPDVVELREGFQRWSPALR